MPKETPEHHVDPDARLRDWTGSWFSPDIDGTLRHIQELVYPTAKYVAMQVEVCPKTQRDHIQWFIQFRRGRTFADVKKLMPGAHIEPRKRSPKACSDYCTKEDTRKPDTVAYTHGELCSG